MTAFPGYREKKILAVRPKLVNFCGLGTLRGLVWAAVQVQSNRDCITQSKVVILGGLGT